MGSIYLGYRGKASMQGEVAKIQFLYLALIVFSSVCSSAGTWLLLKPDWSHFPDYHALSQIPQSQVAPLEFIPQPLTIHMCDRSVGWGRVGGDFH